MLPLSYQHRGLLHALLGLAACHLGSSGIDTSQFNQTSALEHKLSAIQALSAFLIKEEMLGLNAMEEDITLAIVLLLVLHDICESGMSSHGTHLNGVTFLCARFVEQAAEPPSPFRMFLLAALAWLDVLRGFSGAEKLAYPPEVRRYILAANDFSLETLVGCPAEIFHRIGQVLSAGKDFLAGSLSDAEFQALLQESEQSLRDLDLDQEAYPTKDPEWKILAEAYRHSCILRILRFPDSFGLPCDDDRVVESVVAILDASAEIPRGSAFYKRLLFPLFLAGADASTPHQKHYVQLCIDEIKQSTGFRHQAMTGLLDKVWEERAAKTRGWVNVPWMEFVSLPVLRHFIS
ncbi:hypothetical protein A1O3_09349 [Capronia epimyces CBS 606.96]|uniref:Uncharacterized protein n=1 Tax=Capronia epimyces CBS 606.96 TaxID=1182542 RepID=W9XD97_9EURO|nr:uncharacterized protein A1O3_09349 [Capronia epimyces CBS 606.96]EXJ78188.1 hypothetical protein A1O3_09349 [Capronia epimyces CBS 606.96]